jgi:O-antigen ligase
MSPPIATLIFTVGILGLFALNRDRKARTSMALWIPVLWFLLAGSRPLSQWLQAQASVDSAEQYLEGSPLDRNVYTALIAAGLMALVPRRRQVAKLLVANTPIVLFLSYCAVSVIWSDYPGVAFKRWTKAVGDLIMVLIILTEFKPTVALRRILARMAFLLIPLSILLIRYYPALGRAYDRWTWLPSYVGVTENKNLLGMITLVCGLGATWRLCEIVRSQAAPHRISYLIANGSILMMVCWILITAHSATSLSCFVMAGTLLVATNFFSLARRPLIIHASVGAIVVLSITALFFDPGGSLVESLGKDPTLTGRTEIWRAVLLHAGNPFLGTGFESFWLGDRLQKLRMMFANNPLMEAHNGYLELYLNLGWIGVSLAALVILTGYRSVVAAVRHDLDASSLRLAYFTVAVVYNLTEAAFKELNPVWIFFLFAIVAVPRVTVQRKTPVPRIADVECSPSDYLPQIENALSRVSGAGVPS